jgi:hypothetical protein
MAVGMLGVLTVTGTTLIYYSSTNARSAEYSNDNSNAYSLAEAGLNEMMAVLAKPDNNALDPALLPATSSTYDAGTVTWSGTLDQAAAMWSLTSTGRIKNPTGAAGDVTRTLRASVPVVPTNTQPANNQSWNYIMSTGTGDPDGCDMEIGSTVEVRTNLYVFGNLCLQNQAKVLKAVTNPVKLVVNGSLDQATQHNTVGTSAEPIAEAHIAGNCAWFNQAWHFPCSNADKVYATILDSTAGTLVAPSVDFDRWWRNASPGPFIPCATGGPLTFDTNNETTTGPDRSVLGTYNLTPSASYSCTTLGGELTWDAVGKVLTVRGTVFFDGHVRVEPQTPGTVIQYRGQATIYAYGSVAIKNAKLCASVSGSDCAFSTWNPNVDLLAFVSNGDGGQSDVSTGDSITVKGSHFQGSLYATRKINIDTFSKVDGPLIGSEVILGQSVSTDDFPDIETVPVGMPGAPTVYAQPGAPQLYSG